MMITAVSGGAFMFGVHFFSKKIPESEYGILGTLLATLNCISIPSLGLQMVFAQQTASAVTPEQHRQLTGTIRAILVGTLFIWLAIALVVVAGHREILARLQITNPAGLWVTLLIGLACIWGPIFSGLLQGAQNFLWMGWTSILGGAGRLLAVAIIVLVFGGYAAGIMTGALLGMIAVLLVAAWQTKELWKGQAAPFDWRRWLAKVIPLTLGFGACQFMFSADPIFVQSYFPKEKTGFYMAAGTLCRALVAFTGPIAAVMFPKVVRSVARSEKTDVVTLTLLTTLVLACLGALGIWLIAPWLLPFVFTKSFLEAKPLLPWFGFGMVPLTLANVLVNGALAKGQFRIVPWLVGVAACYAGTLYLVLSRGNATFLTVTQILGGFNLIFLMVALFFSRKGART
ncbi:MAG: hypothetical protein JWM16_5735 [Verrucomicrobiales bacterium]|nr:hypothetical protein [Verrucomicrobiales bacterium]